MKKLIFILLISLNVFPKNYTVDELLSIYEENSLKSKEMSITENQNDLKEKDIKRGTIDDFSIELNPNILSNNEKNSYVYSLGLSYKKFYYKTGFSQENEKLTEVIGYKTSLYNGFFEEKLNKKTSITNLEIEKIKSEKEFVEDKKLFIEKIYSYLTLLENIRIYQENLKEAQKEKEILSKKEKLGEATYLDILNNENELFSLKNSLDFVQKENESACLEIKKSIGINDDFNITRGAKDFLQKSDSLDLQILNKTLIVIDGELKKEKLKELKNFNFSYEYNEIEKSNMASISYVYRPFEKDINKNLLILDKKKLELKTKEEIDKKNKEVFDNNNKYSYLKEEFERTRSYYEKYRLYFEDIKDRFEKEKISYSDYLKIKKEFREIEKSLNDADVEFQKFIWNCSL